MKNNDTWVFGRSHHAKAEIVVRYAEARIPQAVGYLSEIYKVAYSIARRKGGLPNRRVIVECILMRIAWELANPLPWVRNPPQRETFGFTMSKTKLYREVMKLVESCGRILPLPYVPPPPPIVTERLMLAEAFTPTPPNMFVLRKYRWEKDGYGRWVRFLYHDIRVGPEGIFSRGRGV